MKLVWPLTLSLLVHALVIQWKPAIEIEQTGSSGRTALNIQKMKFVTSNTDALNEQKALIEEKLGVIDEGLIHDEKAVTPVVEKVKTEVAKKEVVKKRVKAELKKPMVKHVEKKSEKPKTKPQHVAKKVSPIKQEKKKVHKQKKRQEKKLETVKKNKEVINEIIEKDTVIKQDVPKVDAPVKTVALHDTDLMSDKKEELEVVADIDSNQSNSGFDQIPTMSEPRYRKAFPPEYPRLARKRGQQGLVLVRAKVDQHGEVEEVELIQSSGVKSLDVRAVETVEKWLFYPYKVADKPTVAWVNIPVDFTLK